MDISKAIRTLREEKRLTQLEIADKLQMERSNYARLEARGNKLSVEQLEQIAGALGVSVLELMTGEPQKMEDTGKVKELEKRIKELETDKHYLSTTVDLIQEKVKRDEAVFLNIGKALGKLFDAMKAHFGGLSSNDIWVKLMEVEALLIERELYNLSKKNNIFDEDADKTR